MSSVGFEGVTWNETILTWTHNPQENSATLNWATDRLPAGLQEALRKYGQITVTESAASILDVDAFARDFPMRDMAPTGGPPQVPHVRLAALPTVSLSSSQNASPHSAKTYSDGDGSSARRPHSDRSHHRHSPKKSSGEVGHPRVIKGSESQPVCSSSSADVATVTRSAPEKPGRRKTRHLSRINSQGMMRERLKRPAASSVSVAVPDAAFAKFFGPAEPQKTPTSVPDQEYLSIAVHLLCEPYPDVRRDTLEYLGRFAMKNLNPASDNGPLLPSTLFTVKALRCLQMCQSNLRLSVPKRALMETLQALFNGSLDTMYKEWVKAEQPDASCRKEVFSYFQMAMRAAMVMAGTMGVSEFEILQDTGHTFLALLDQKRFAAAVAYSRVMREDLVLSRLLVLTDKSPVEGEVSESVRKAIKWFRRWLREVPDTSPDRVATRLAILRAEVDALRPILRDVETVMIENKADRQRFERDVSAMADTILGHVSLRSLLPDSLKGAEALKNSSSSRFWPSKGSSVIGAFADAFGGREYHGHVSMLTEADTDFYCTEAIAKEFRKTLETLAKRSSSTRVAALINTVKKHILMLPTSLEARSTVDSFSPAASSSSMTP